MIQFTAYAGQDTAGAKYFYLSESRTRVTTRVALLDWLTARQRPTLTNIPDDLKGQDILKMSGTEDELAWLKDYPAVHVFKSASSVADSQLSDPTHDVYVYGVLFIEGVVDSCLLFKLQDDGYLPPFVVEEQFTLSPGMIANYTAEKSVITDVGKFIVNQLVLADPFGDLIPYQNTVIIPDKLDDMVAEGILNKKITRAMYNKYMANGYWFGEDGSLTTQAWSERSLITDPAIAKRKAELLKQYQDHLNDPIILAKIEKELIDMDKAWLKGDPSEPFFKACGSKVWNEQRKKFFIMIGMGSGFSKKDKSVTFIPRSLGEGIEAQDIANIGNDVRRGSYGRGKETAKGGAETKFLLRIFQVVKITEDDCVTHRGNPVEITEFNYKSYIERYTTDGTILTEEVLKASIGKTLIIRSPMYCETKGGFCAKCCGEFLRRLDMKVVGVQALGVSQGFVSSSMKKLHVSSLPSTDIKDLSAFIVE